MLPNFHNGDYLLVDEISFRLRKPQRGEVVVFQPPNHNPSPYIKRIIGLPGETIKISEGRVVILKERGGEVLDESAYLPAGVKTKGNLTVVLGKQEYFVLGDNRSFSSDSRIFGVVHYQEIIGRVFFRVLPLNRMGRIKGPNYQDLSLNFNYARG